MAVKHEPDDAALSKFDSSQLMGSNGNGGPFYLKSGNFKKSRT